VVPADLITPGIIRLSSTPRRVFPFGLRQQPIGFGGHPREPDHVLLRVIPGQVDDWLSAASKSAVRHLRASTNGDAGVPLFKGDLEFGCGERLDDRHLVLRLLVGKGTLSGEPIMKLPAGTTIISGQSLAHSLKESPGFNARSPSAVSTCSVRLTRKELRR